MKQIIVTLIGFAVKYTNKGYVKISSALNELDRMFAIIIEDTGAGMSKK